MGRTRQLATPTAGTLGIARRAARVAVLVGLPALLLAGRAAALTPLATFDATPDTTVDFGTVTVADHEVARHASGLVSAVSLGLPAGVAIDGFNASGVTGYGGNLFHDTADGSVSGSGVQLSVNSCGGAPCP